MGSLARKAKRRTEEKTLRSARDLRAPLRTLATACHAVIAARKERQDPIAAIEQQIAWPRFVKCVSQAQAMIGVDVTDTKMELLAKYTTVRAFAPALLDTFSFRGDRTASSLPKALDVLCEMWRTGRRSLPANAPTGFIRQSWRSFVFQSGAIERRAYEICVLSELRNRLRASDVWVGGSRRYQAFEATLIPQSSFELLKAEGPLPVAVDPVFVGHIAGRRELLQRDLSLVTWLAKAGTLPDATLTDGELKISPVRADTPEEAETANELVYNLLPRVKITDVLLEIDSWTGFSECFTHQRSGRPVDDRNALLTAILADGIKPWADTDGRNLRSVTLRQLAWVHDWHIREEAYGGALARLIEAHRALPIARLWGDGSTSSSDGQYFRAGSQGAARNALDCAFWDMDAKRAYRSVTELAGLGAATPVVTAFTLDFDTPDKMAEQAAANRSRPLLKLEFFGDGDVERVQAVRQAAPTARIIVDANESWNEAQLREFIPALSDCRVRSRSAPTNPAGRLPTSTSSMGNTRPSISSSTRPAG
jgi:hypothetical protein